MMPAAPVAGGKRMPRRTVLALGAVGALVAGALAVGGAATAFYLTPGSGSGTGSTGSAADVTLTPVPSGAGLYPGASTDVVVIADNPGDAAVRIVSLQLDATQGTSGFAIRDAAGQAVPGCSAASFSFATQSTGWNLAPTSSTSITLPNALTMNAAAENACQGVVVTAFLRTTTSSTAYSTAIMQTAGLVDYFRLGAAPDTFTDAQGPVMNNATSTAPPATGTVGAINGDTDTAVTFDGVDDFARITRTIGNDFSIEFWFKSTQGLDIGPQWWQGAGLVDAEVAGAAQDFGVSLSADGRVMAGAGGPDVTVSSVAGFDNDVWHHVVMTRVQDSGLITLYIDGVSAGSATGPTVPLTSPANIDFGRIQAGNNYYQGGLDEIALYSTALTSSEVQAHYSNAR